MLVQILFFFIFFMTFFSGLLTKLGIPSAFTFSIEFAVITLLIVSLSSRSGRGYPDSIILKIFLFFIIVSFFSSLLNEMDLIRSIESLRLLFRFYFFYLAIIYIEPEDVFFKKVNIFLVILILFQFPIIAVKFVQWGIREGTSGGWLRAGHTTAVIWPTLIFFCLAYYYFYGKKIFFIILAFASLVASIVGGKRLVFFIYPVQFVAIYYFIYSKVSKKTFSNHIFTISVISGLIIGVSFSSMYLMKTLNPEKQVGGDIDLMYAFEYSKGYVQGVTASGYTFGRVSTTFRVFDILVDAGKLNFLFGVGPGVSTAPVLGDKNTRLEFEKRFDEFKIHYGLTPMNRIALEYGVFGVVLFGWMLVFLSIKSWRLYKYETDPYWKAFAAGSVGFAFYAVFLFFTYSHGVFWAYTIPPLYYYTMAVVSIRYRKLPHKINLGTFEKNKFNYNIPAN